MYVSLVTNGRSQGEVIMKISAVVIIIALFFLAGCSGTPAASPTSTTTPVNPTAVAPVTTPPPVSTTAPATTTASVPAVTTTTPPITTAPAVTTSVPTATGPYTGPLFDTHLHLDENTLMSRFGSANGLMSFLNGGDVDWAVGFYLLPTSYPASSIAAIATAAAAYIVPLFQDPNWSQFFASAQSAASELQQYLQPQGPYQGAGEIALYSTDLQSVTFDNPAMQAVFQAVNDVKGVVMIHLSTANMGGRATELSEVEPSVAEYTDTTFLFHGRKEDMKLVAQLMDKYPNVYFTIDANDSIFTAKLTGYNLLFPAGAADDTAARFLADVDTLGTEALIQNGLDNLTTLLDMYPDRVLWGTDLSSTWHFDDAVFDTIISLSRAVIGRLPADQQEKYAYLNAQAVFGRFFTATP
jgi:hypothetical protein